MFIFYLILMEINNKNSPYVISCVTVSSKETITVWVMDRIDGEKLGDLEIGTGVLWKLALSLPCSLSNCSIALFWITNYLKYTLRVMNGELKYRITVVRKQSRHFICILTPSNYSHRVDGKFDCINHPWNSQIYNIFILVFRCQIIYTIAKAGPGYTVSFELTYSVY